MTRIEYELLRRDRPDLFIRWGSFGEWFNLNEHDRQVIIETPRDVAIQVLAEQVLCGPFDNL